MQILLATRSRRRSATLDFVLEAPATSQYAPGDARELVGERDRQHVAVQPLLGRLDPGLSPWRFPLLGLT